MKRRLPAPLPALLPALLIPAFALGACSTGDHGGRFPSLLPRDVEKHDDLEPVHVTPVPTVDPALDAAVAAADKRLAESTARFATAADQAATVIAAAANADSGSDAWLGAQRALGSLDTAQADTTNIAADLDLLAIARAQKGLPEYPALNALRERVQAQLDAETQRITGLRNRVKAA